MGRPTKLDAKVADTIITAVRAGSYLETAAALAGIDKATLFRWLKEGARRGEGPLTEFCNAVQKAMADAELCDLTVITKAAEAGTWQAAAWRLERKHPDRYALPRRMTVEVRKAVDDELEAVMTRLERKLPPDVFTLVCEAVVEDDDAMAEQSALRLG